MLFRFVLGGGAAAIARGAGGFAAELELGAEEAVGGGVVHEEDDDEGGFAADLGAEATLVTDHEAGGAPLAVLVADHGDAMALFVSDDEAALGAFHEDDALGGLEFVGGDGAFGAFLQGFELGAEFADSSVELAFVEGQGMGGSDEQCQCDGDGFGHAGNVAWKPWRGNGDFGVSR